MLVRQILQKIDAENSLEVWKIFTLHKSNDFVDKIVRFVYNIIENRAFLFKTIIIGSSRKGG